METWYKFYGWDLKEVPVVRETGRMLVLPASQYFREHKVPKNGHYKSKLEALTALVQDINKSIEYHRDELAEAETAISKVTSDLETYVRG